MICTYNTSSSTYKNVNSESHTCAYHDIKGWFWTHAIGLKPPIGYMMILRWKRSRDTCLMKVMMIAKIGERAAGGWNVTRHDTQWQLHLQQFQQLQQLLSKAFVRTIFLSTPPFDGLFFSFNSCNSCFPRPLYALFFLSTPPCWGLLQYLIKTILCIK